MRRYGCNKGSLGAFLGEYGFHEDLRKDFVRRVMGMTRQHGIDVPAEVFGVAPAASRIPRLEHLAAMLWNLDLPGVEERPRLRVSDAAGRGVDIIRRACHSTSADGSDYTQLPATVSLRLAGRIERTLPRQASKCATESVRNRATQTGP